MKQPPIEETRFGFIYGPAHVERVGSGPKGHVALFIGNGEGKFVEVTVSPGGKSVRVHDQDGYELTRPLEAQDQPTNTKGSK